MSLNFVKTAILASNAKAQVLPDVWLGTGISEDFDGLLIDGYLMSGKEDNAAKVLVTGELGGSTYLNIWINFDNDSQFNNSNELILSDVFISPTTPVIMEDGKVEDAFAAIYKFQIPVQESVHPGLYSLRVELNTLPQGEGEIVDFAQIVVPIMDQEYIDIANGVVDFSHERPNALGYTRWEPDNTLSSSISSFFSSISNFFTGRSKIAPLTTPTQGQASTQDLKISENGDLKKSESHEPQNAEEREDWEIALYFFAFGLVIAFNIYLCVRHFKKKRIEKKYDQMARERAANEAELPKTEEEGFGSAILRN